MDEKGEYLPLENTSSPPHAGQSPPDTGDVSTEISVNYGKSFHLRFAGNSTVRKERPKLRKKREDGDDDSTDDEDEEEDVVTTAEVQSAAAATESAPTDSQELRLKLSQRECILSCTIICTVLCNKPYALTGKYCICIR